MAKGRMYIVGHKDHGFVIVKTNPLRATSVSSEEIKRYEQASGGDGYAKLTDTFRRVAAGLGKTGKSDSAGPDVHEADFAIFAEIDDAEMSAANASNASNAHNANNAIVSPIQNVLSHIGPEAPHAEHLRASVLSDVKPK